MIFLTDCQKNVWVGQQKNLFVVFWLTKLFCNNQISLRQQKILLLAGK